MGKPLLPWQRWVAIHALEVLPDGTYRFRKVIIVVARQNGKSDLKRTITLWRMFMNPNLRVLGVAQELDLAKEQWQMCQDSISESEALAAEYDPPGTGKLRNVNGQETFWLANGARYKIKASNRKAGRGGSNDEVNIDELREMRDWKPWAAISKTTSARPNSQIWCMSNAGDDESVVLNQLRDAALTGRDDTLGLFEYSGQYEDDNYCDLDDWQQVAQANPGLGYIISARAIASDMVSDPPEIFRTEVLCQRVRHLDAAIDMTAWAACADPAVTMDSLRNRLAVCLDVAPDGAHATLAVAARTTDGKVRGEIAASWPTAADARRELPPLLARMRPSVIGWFPSGPAAELAPIFRAPDGRAAIKLTDARPGRPAYEDLNGTRASEACMGLAGLVKGHQVLHNSDPLLNSHAGDASRLRVGDGWRFVRRADPGTDPSERGHVDAVYAFAGAVYLAQLMPEPRRARVRLLTA